MWTNSADRYGVIHIALHWLTAIGVLGMFALGLYMVGLGYYDSWYHQAPAIHKSIGLLLFALLLLRLLWVAWNPGPRPLASARWQRRAARLLHAALYLILLLLFTSGYLIAAADGDPIPVFDLFAVPAWELPIEQQEEVAGDVHEVLAWFVVLLAAVHALAALKHHFGDRDPTLRRMLWHNH